MLSKLKSVIVRIKDNPDLYTKMINSRAYALEYGTDNVVTFLAFLWSDDFTHKNISIINQNRLMNAEFYDEVERSRIIYDRVKDYLVNFSKTNMKCMKCKREPIEIILLPCGHIVLCTRCAYLTNCPKCETKIESTHRIFL